MIASGTKCLLKKLQGSEGGLTELDGIVAFPPKVGEGLVIGDEENIWRTSPIQRIEVAGRSYFIYTKNSIYQLEIKDEDNETHS